LPVTVVVDSKAASGDVVGALASLLLARARKAVASRENDKDESKLTGNAERP
jgi:hypothetical protein